MFSQYTWGDFFKVMIPLTIVYYVIIGWKFYRKDIRDFFSRSKAGKATPEVATNPDLDEDDSDLFQTVSYPLTSASAGVGTQAPAKPKKERKKREKKEPKKPVDQTPAPEPPPTAESAPKEIDIPDAPVANEGIQDGFLEDLTGISTPLAEEPVESIVEAAKDLDVHDDGSITAKPEAGPGAQRLAKLASRKSLPAAIDNLPFNR